jgi:hypothetical protein
MTNSSSSPDPSHDPALTERTIRHNVMLRATVERFGGTRSTSHRVRDLSTGGVRIDQAEGLPVGATVLITVGALQSVGATVVWVKDGSAGLKFAQPINIDDARAKAAIAPRREPDRVQFSGPVTPSAGWMPTLTDAYRKR